VHKTFASPYEQKFFYVTIQVNQGIFFKLGKKSIIKALLCSDFTDDDVFFLLKIY